MVFKPPLFTFVEYPSDIADLKSHDIYNNKKKSNASLTFRWH